MGRLFQDDGSSHSGALKGHRTVKGCFIQETGTDQEDRRHKRAAPKAVGVCRDGCKVSVGAHRSWAVARTIPPLRGVGNAVELVEQTRF